MILTQKKIFMRKKMTLVIRQISIFEIEICQISTTGSSRVAKNKYKRILYTLFFLHIWSIVKFG